MRLLVVSDIHGNLTALREVLDDAGEHDLAVCAGDIVGYGPEPGGCVEALRELNARYVAGNHDVEVTTGESFGANPYAAQAIRIHRRLLRSKQKKWLSSLPRSLHIELDSVKVAVFHGSPIRPLREYIFPMDAQIQAEHFLDSTGADVIILGHTHVPYVVRTGGGLIVNPGSVGQPRDGDPRASYAMLDLAGDEVEVANRRVEYDIDLVASQIREQGIPVPLASRLYVGR
jgi:putative phosphoesterase